MSDAIQEDEELQLDDQDALAPVLLSLKRQRLWLLALTGMCLVALLVSVTVPALLARGASAEAHTDAEELLAPVQARLGDLIALSEAGEAERALQAQRLEALGQRLASLDVNGEAHAIVALQRILVRQEHDYRSFLNTLEQGMYAIHLMVPHSRAWWEQYRAELDGLIKLSRARENYITAIRED